MPRPLALLAALIVLLAGVWAFRPGAGATAFPVAVARAAHRPMSDLVPRQPPAPPRFPVASPVTDSTPITVVVEARAAGETRFLVMRAWLDGAMVLVAAPDGRIPAFATPGAARAWADRVLPRPTEPGVAALYDDMSRRLDEDRTHYDFDAAYAWARRPTRDGLAPTPLLGTWGMLALGGELPMPPRGDPMSVAFARGEDGNRALSDDEELALSLMKVDLVVSLARHQEGTIDAATWPDDALVWSDADARRIGGEMADAIPALVARFTDDVAGVERALGAR